MYLPDISPISPLYLPGSGGRDLQARPPAAVTAAVRCLTPPSPRRMTATITTPLTALLTAPEVIAHVQYLYSTVEPTWGAVGVGGAGNVVCCVQCGRRQAGRLPFMPPFAVREPNRKRFCRSCLPHALPQHSVRTGYPHTPTQGINGKRGRDEGGRSPGARFDPPRGVTTPALPPGWPTPAKACFGWQI